MLARFAVVNGIPGTGVQQALKRYADWCGRNGYSTPLIISLEEDYLVPLAKDTASSLLPRFQPADVTIMEVLRLPKPLLMDLWTQAFESVNDAVQASVASDQPVILTFHGVWFHLGVREYVSGINFASIANLQRRPDVVFTLIDVVYDIKARLTKPKGVFSYDVDTPDVYLTEILRLLRILDWRNTENVLSSKVAEISRAPQYVLAVKHPISVFYDLFAGTDKKLVYVAHPITEIRRLRRGTENQKQMAEDIVERIQDLYRRLREHFIVFEPTAIDELRFDLTFELDKQSMDLPYLGQRWPLPSVETSDLLCEKPENLEDAFGKEWMRIGNAIAQNESETLGQGQGEMVRRAWPSLAALQEQILQQITSRDFTLVTQANGLAVYRPVFRGHASVGWNEKSNIIKRYTKRGRRKLRWLSYILNQMSMILCLRILSVWSSIGIQKGN